MRIAAKLTGNPYRYAELLAANPHKPITYSKGLPTFASLREGEELIVPASFAHQVGTGSFFSKLFKAVTSPLTAPIKAVATVAKGGNVIKAVTTSIADPIKATVQAADALTEAPSDLLKKLGLPDPLTLVHKAGIPTDPSAIAKMAVNPKAVLALIPGVSAINKYLPAAPDPFKMATNLYNAGESGDLKQLKKVSVDIGHTVADVIAMIPSVGEVFGGALNSALSLLENGSPLKAAFEFLLGEIPGIPGDIRDVFLRPVLDGIADIIEKHESVEDAFFESLKEGVMNEAHSRGIPDIITKLISGLIDAVIQLILRHKPLKQVAVGFAEKGLSAAVGAAAKSAKLPPEITSKVDSLKQTYESAKTAALDKFSVLSEVHLPADVQKTLGGLKQTYTDARTGLLAKLPPATVTQINSLQGAYDGIKSVGNKSNEIYALTQGIRTLNLKDPKKLSATIQKQIADLKANISVQQVAAGLVKKSLDATLGPTPSAFVPLPPVMTEPKKKPVQPATPVMTEPKKKPVQPATPVMTEPKKTPARPPQAPATKAPVMTEPQKKVAAAANAALAPTSTLVPSRPPLQYAPYPQQVSGAVHGVLSGPDYAPYGMLSGPPPTCRALGEPISNMPHEMHRAGMSAVQGSGGRSRMVHGPDGNDYLFALEGGTLTARRCFS